jgi:ABC-type transport system involved in cytochrome c biogenesis permease component
LATVFVLVVWLVHPPRLAVGCDGVRAVAAAAQSAARSDVLVPLMVLPAYRPSLRQSTNADDDVSQKLIFVG